MPGAITYFVKREPALFRKARWSIHLDKLKIAERDSQEAALAAAVEEAERSAGLGRTVEIWANNGEGFVLYKSFQPVKKKKGDLDDEDENEGEPRDDEDNAAAAILL